MSETIKPAPGQVWRNVDDDFEEAERVLRERLLVRDTDREWCAGRGIVARWSTDHERTFLWEYADGYLHPGVVFVRWVDGYGPNALPVQPLPTNVSGAEILPLVTADLQARSERGEKKYGTTLRTHNGRSALQDAYEEALDLAMYLRQQLEREREATR